MSAPTETVRRLTVIDIAKLYADGTRIAMITAYDFPTAALVDEAGIPLILVGDSLAQVMLGYDTTVRVTMDEMLHHTKAVVRGTKRALVVGDMPFLSYSTPEDALHNAGRFLARGRRPGGQGRGRRAERADDRGAREGRDPGHGPHRLDAAGDQHAAARSASRARTATRRARSSPTRSRSRRPGAFAIVLELVPGAARRGDHGAAARSRRSASAPAPGARGQVQVITDTLGWGDWHPKHARPYANLRETILGAVGAYRADVEAGTFPGEAETVRMDDAVLDEVLGRSPRTWPAPAATVAAGGDPARPRPLAPRRDVRASMQVVRTRADAARRAGRRRPARRPRARRWAGSMPATSRSIERARAESATVVVVDLREPPAVRRVGGLRAVPAQRGARPRACRGGGRGPRVRAARRRGLPAGLRHGRLGRRDRRGRSRVRRGPATSTASRPSSRSCSRSSGAERAYFGLEGLPAGPGHPPDGARPRAADEVVPCPTVREPDGLALSSRNARLSPDGRAAAPVLRRALLAAPRAWAGGERVRRRAPRRRCASVLARSRSPSVDYVSVADADTLAELEVVDGPALAVARGPLRRRPAHRQRARSRRAGAACAQAGASEERPARRGG